MIMRQSKWVGKNSTELKGASAEQVWGLLAHFCSIHKWFQIVDTSYQLEGVPGEPGLIRYCALRPGSFGDDSNDIKWAKEKLLMMDPIQRCLSYQILDNNMGFNWYVATMQVFPINDGCKIEWSFVSDPIWGWSFQDLLSYEHSCLQFMANKMELALRSTSAASN